MFSVIYSFQIIPDKEDIFLQAWHDLTVLLYRYEGSFGSRIHKAGEHHYLAYAQWPDKQTWMNSGSNLPLASGPVRTQLRSSCIEIKTLYEMEVIDDLLVNQQYDNPQITEIKNDSGSS